MYNQIAVSPTHSIIELPRQEQRWLQYFNPADALQAVKDHIESLPGSRHERHTMKAYMSALSDFTLYLGATAIHLGGENYEFIFEHMNFPNQASIKSYIAYSKTNDLKSSTIVRYLAAVRHFLKALESQQVTPRDGNDFIYLMEAQRQLRLAAAVKNPRADKTSNRPALEQSGIRLNLMQVNTLFNSFEPTMTELPDINTITGKRNLALIYLGITSGLRASEIARISLNKIREGENCYEVIVRGKRNNYDPVGIDNTAHALIMSYIAAFNDMLPPEDTRRITGDTPIWQPLLVGDKPVPLGVRGNRADNGISSRAILKIIERRSHAALNFSITAHDMRRTCAYLMRSNNYEWDQIRAQLRHKSIATTEMYVGKAANLSQGLLSNKVEFDIPQSTIQKLL